MPLRATYIALLLSLSVPCMAGAEQLLAQSSVMLPEAETSSDSQAGASQPVASASSAPAAPSLKKSADLAAAPASDLWDRIRDGFALPENDSDLVREQENWFANRPDYMRRTIDRSKRYMFHIVEEVEKRGMPTEIALLPIIESAYNHKAL